MSSACINPVLYGYLNETFRAEFIQIFQPLRRCCQNCYSSQCAKQKKSQEKNIEELQPLELKESQITKTEKKLIPREPSASPVKISKERTKKGIISAENMVTVHTNPRHSEA